VPTYDYKCDACGHAFELFQSMSADPIRKCPACKKNKVKSLIGTGACLIFKGSGFYITDYRDQSYTDKAKAESGAATGGDSKGDGASTASGNGDAATAKPAATDAKPAGDSKPAASTPAPAKPETKSASKSASKRKSN
jgi:putative FmdB family regulatory protein